MSRSIFKLFVTLLLATAYCQGRFNCGGSACGFGIISKAWDIKGGFDSSVFEGKDSLADKIYIQNALADKKAGIIEGEYIKTDWTLNGRPHYEKVVSGDVRGEKLHLYYSGSQWIIHFDTDPSRNFDNMIAYAKVRISDPRKTSKNWQVKIGKIYVSSPNILTSSSGDILHEDVKKQSIAMNEFLGVPMRLVPLFFAFMLDGVAVGLVMPLMPFYIMELGANAFQLSLVISVTYVAQMIGCILVGQLNDQYGRRPHALACLSTSCISIFLASKVTTLEGIAFSRFLSVVLNFKF